MSYKAGFIGLIGYPNAGKSTLVNALMGEKVSIVTKKPQTTRKKVVAIHTDSEAQVILVDAPGIVQAESGINKFLEEEYKQVIANSDALVAVLNIDEPNPEKLDQVIELVASSGRPWFAVITKNDLPQYHRIALLKQKIMQYDVPVLSVSAVKAPQYIKTELLQQFKNLLPESPKLYEQDCYTTQTEREVCEEIIREKCFERLHQEIPYGLATKVLRFEEADKLIKVYADIYVNKARHKSIVLGQSGKMIKSIGQAARLELEKLLQKKIYLELHVAVKENWVKSDQKLKELGYVNKEL